MKTKLLALELLTIIGFTMATQVNALNNGWVHVDDSWYYLENGLEVKNSWKLIIGNWYYFDQEGKMQTGWKQLNNDWYYLQNDGSCKANCWQDGYYLNSSGRLVEMGWVSYQNDWYYIKASHYAKNTWIGDFYLRGDGRMARNSWVENYYVGADGACVYEAFIGDWYVGTNGKAVFLQWIHKNNHWYYAGRDGRYIRNNSIFNGDIKYFFNANGELIASEKVTRHAQIGNVTCEILSTCQSKYSNANVLYHYLPFGDYYVAERKSLVGQETYQLSIGDTITINNQNYQVIERKTGLTYTDNKSFTQYLRSGGYDIIVQTCDDAATYIVIFKLVLI